MDLASKVPHTRTSQAFRPAFQCVVLQSAKSTIALQRTIFPSTIRNLLIVAAPR